MPVDIDAGEVEIKQSEKLFCENLTRDSEVIFTPILSHSATDLRAQWPLSFLTNSSDRPARYFKDFERIEKVKFCRRERWLAVWTLSREAFLLSRGRRARLDTLFFRYIVMRRHHQTVCPKDSCSYYILPDRHWRPHAVAGTEEPRGRRVSSKLFSKYFSHLA